MVSKLSKIVCLAPSCLSETTCTLPSSLVLYIYQVPDRSQFLLPSARSPQLETASVSSRSASNAIPSPEPSQTPPSITHSPQYKVKIPNASRPARTHFFFPFPLALDTLPFDVTLPALDVCAVVALLPFLTLSSCLFCVTFMLIPGL